MVQTMSYYNHRYFPSGNRYEYDIDSRVRHRQTYDPTISYPTQNYNLSNDEATAVSIMYLGSYLFTPVRWVLSFCC